MTPILAFKEWYAPRMWGGTRLRSVFGKAVPAGEPIGEAWLVSDHPEHESVVADGPHAGRTLRDLLQEDARAILGRRAQLTVHGRFPLLLKLLDAGDKLSIQVHPNDDDARRLNEPDVGKTEMWYIVEGDPGSVVYCGIPSGLSAAEFDEVRRAGRLGGLLEKIDARPGTAVFVSAGTVHAIGGGCLLAEIQQNSDLTYRIDDWGRVQADGSPRTLHLDKAMQVIDFQGRHSGAAKPLAYEVSGARINVLGACGYFAAERMIVSRGCEFDTRGDSFQLCLGLDGRLTVSAGDNQRDLAPGCALMIAGASKRFGVLGSGSFLRYYVPDLARDVAAPLGAAGHDPASIRALGLDAKSGILVPGAGVARDR